MTQGTLLSIAAEFDGAGLVAFEPNDAEILSAAPALAAFNNDQFNASMMTNTQQMTAAEIVDVYSSLRGEAGRPFLLEHNGKLVGDADFRNIDGDSAEFAILIGARTQQSRGLGTQCAMMLHALAFNKIHLDKVYATVIPLNKGSIRMLEKLGYQLDSSARALALREAADDIVMSISRAAFELNHAKTITHFRMGARTTL